MEEVWLLEEIILQTIRFSEQRDEWDIAVHSLNVKMRQLVHHRKATVKLLQQELLVIFVPLQNVAQDMTKT